MYSLYRDLIRKPNFQNVCFPGYQISFLCSALFLLHFSNFQFPQGMQNFIMPGYCHFYVLFSYFCIHCLHRKKYPHIAKISQKGVISCTKIPNFIWKYKKQVHIVSTSETPTYRNEQVLGQFQYNALLLTIGHAFDNWRRFETVSDGFFFFLKANQSTHILQKKVGKKKFPFKHYNNFKKWPQIICPSF